MEPEGEMTLDLFTIWDVKSLQTYLGRRGWNKTGNKATLVARAFAAWELGVPIIPLTIYASLFTHMRIKIQRYQIVQY